MGLDYAVFEAWLNLCSNTNDLMNFDNVLSEIRWPYDPHNPTIEISIASSKGNY